MSNKQQDQSWWLRFVKGMFVGSGFIIPGVSGGALAAIFGIYERIIRFLADIRRDFVENVKFFIPVGLGALFGIAILSWGVSFLLGNYATIILWFFVGCILGTAPSLWNEAGKEGRNNNDYLVMTISFIMGIVLLGFGNQIINGQVAPSFLAWVLCGFLIALGGLVPGLSPSNFIVYMGLYKDMADGFKTFDLGVIIPIGIGGLLTVILLSKFIEKLVDNHYSHFFHFILGIVFASTIMIIPTNYTGFTMIQYFMCFVLLLLGTLLGAWMAKLEDRYK